VHSQRGADMQYFEGKEANLESLVCTPTLCVLAGVQNGLELDVTNEKHQTALALVGKYLGRGMIAVRNGEIRDINPENQWTPEEVIEAKQTSVYLLGGGIMGSAMLAASITRAAEHELKVPVGPRIFRALINLICMLLNGKSVRVEEHSIRIVPMGCENPAVLAAALLLPTSARLGAA
jgi:hypothetical protein